MSLLVNEHFLTSHNIFRIKHTELNEMYTVMSIRSFITGMVGIFIPIYLYTIGYGIGDILLLNFFQFAFEAILEYPSARALHHFGPKHNIAFSLPVLVTYFWLLWTLPTYHWPFAFVGFMGSLTLAFFWQGYHFDFSRSKSKKKATKQVSKMYIMLAILGAIAPFIGGSISTYFGFKTLFGVVIFLMLFAVFPLLKNGEKHEKRKFNLKKLAGRNLWRPVIAYGASGIEATAALYVWPLFVFLVVKTTQKVGLVTSAALLLTILITYYVGKNADQKGRCGYIKMGAFLTGIIYFVKAIASNIFQIFTLNVFTSVSHSLFTSPFVTEYYLHADEEARGEFIFVMEIWIDIFRAVYSGILYLLSFYSNFQTVLVAGILLGGISSFFIGLMPEAICEVKNRKIRVNPRITSK